MRGYYGIGIWHPKADVNVGSLLRSAASLGAAFVFTIGRRYTQEATDTTKAWRHVPLWHFEAFADLRAALPFHCWLGGRDEAFAAALRVVETRGRGAVSRVEDGQSEVRGERTWLTNQESSGRTQPGIPCAAARWSHRAAPTATRPA